MKKFLLLGVFSVLIVSALVAAGNKTYHERAETLKLSDEKVQSTDRLKNRQPNNQRHMLIEKVDVEKPMQRQNNPQSSIKQNRAEKKQSSGWWSY